MLLVQFQQLGTGSMHDLEILHQCAKKVKDWSQKILGANSYICRSYRGKSDTGAFAPCWIGLTIRIWLFILLDMIAWNNAESVLSWINGKDWRA